MASVQLRGTSYACIFCWHGKRQWFTIGKVTEDEAKTKASRVEYLLMRLKQRLIQLPPCVGIVEFVQHDGKPPSTHPALLDTSKGLNLSDFRDRYLSTHRDSLEERTIDTLNNTKRLKSSGYTQEQAEAQAQILAEIVDENLVTKADLASTEPDLEHSIVA